MRHWRRRGALPAAPSARTGRTHQLRLHMASIGHPLAGDWLYGTEDPALIPRPALHAWGLTLRHPVSGAVLSFQTALPADMARLLRPCSTVTKKEPGPRSIGTGSGLFVDAPGGGDCKLSRWSRPSPSRQPRCRSACRRWRRRALWLTGPTLPLLMTMSSPLYRR